MTYSLEVKKQATRLRMQGATYREIAREIGTSDDTIRNWFADESEEALAYASSAKARRQLEIMLDAGVDMLNTVHQEYDSYPPREKVQALRTVMLAIDGRIRLTQDRQRDNALIATLREQLKDRPLHEVRATYRLLPDTHATP